jgi:hypothetical protein
MRCPSTTGDRPSSQEGTSGSVRLSSSPTRSSVAFAPTSRQPSCRCPTRRRWSSRRSTLGPPKRLGWVTHGYDRSKLARESVGVPWSNDAAFAGYRDLVQDRRFLIGGDWNTARFVDDAGMPEPAGAEFFERAAAAGWVELSLDEDREVRSWFGPGGERPYQPDHVFTDPVTAGCLLRFEVDSTARRPSSCPTMRRSCSS